MRILIANPNISQSVTDLLTATARRWASPGTEVVGVTATQGFSFIATRAEAAIGAYAALEIIGRHHQGFDAVVLAAFGDPGLDAARELLDIPVVGLSEAALLTACMVGRRFSIVTFATALGPWFQDCVASHGLTSRLASIRLNDTPFQDIGDVQNEKEAQLIALCLAAVSDGADVVILAGAPLSGLAEKIADRVPVPLIDGMAAAIRQAEALAGLRLLKATAGSQRRPTAKLTVGLPPDIAGLFAG
jgi:Asp/Glu/hydantoin racemase